MRRIICSFLIISSILCLLGCGEKESKMQADFYYVRKGYVYGQADGVMAAEARSIAEFSNTQEILDAYLTGPENPSLDLPFAAGTEIIDFLLTGDTLYITLSSHIVTLSKANQVLACTCLARTAMELTGIQEVHFATDSNGVARMDPIVITSDSYLLFDDYNSNTPNNTEE